MQNQEVAPHMVTPDDVLLMTEEEKLDLLRQVADANEWQSCFEPLYVRLMDDDSPKVRREAIGALWEVADERHIEALMEKAAKDSDVNVRAKATSVLGIYIYDGAVEGVLKESEFLAVRSFLLDLAQSPSEELPVRRMAIEALSFDADDTVQDLIEWAYRHADQEMRMSAVFAMGRSRNPRWTEAIMAELESTDRELQLEAINAAGESGIAVATPRLRVLATVKDREVAIAAVWALAHTAGPGAVETIEMLTQSDDEEIRHAASDALEEFYQVTRGADEEMDEDSEDGEDYR